MVLGPNTGLGHTSVLYMVESQVAYIVDALKHMARRRAATIEVRDDALDAYVREIDSGLAASVWNTGGCRSWYLDRTGRNAVDLAGRDVQLPPAPAQLRPRALRDRRAAPRRASRRSPDPPATTTLAVDRSLIGALPSRL